MISEDEARRRILDITREGPPENVALADALDRFAAHDVIARVSSPPFDNSSMDGYALRAADSHDMKPLRVTAEQPAGLDLGLKLEPGAAIRIFTGAPLPSGADAVIMQEDVDVLADNQISCREPVEPGENIRRAGADLCIGQLAISRGARLTPARIGLLASQGIVTARVRAAPRVTVLSTGDELAAAGTQLAPGQIYNSNGPMLRALLARDGIHDVRLAHCGDDFEDTLATLAELCTAADFLLISGGVSVGDRDQVKPALARLGLPPDLWRVRMKPGKPFLFAHRDQPRPLMVFGLPGNPVSGFVTFHALVRPALLKWLGASDSEARWNSILMRVSTAISNSGDRPHYVRGQITNDGFTPLPMQQSHALHGLGLASALLRMEPEERIAAGETRPVFLV